MNENKTFPHILVYIGLLLIIASLVGAIIVGNTDNIGIKAKLERSEAIRISVDEALARSIRSDKESRTASDNLRIRIGELEQSIAGMAVEIRAVGEGQDDLNLAYQRFIERLQKHGQIVERFAE